MFRVAQFEAKVLAWWRSQRAKIDMNPEYQRKGKLWSDQDKAFLVDSILNDYDIPKVYIADFTMGPSVLNERSLPYAIVDGKQRFEAIFDFYDGRIRLLDDFVYREDPSLSLSGLSYADLRKTYSDVADKFDNFHLSVIRIVTDEEEQINELFIRLNRSKPLTGAEIRNAMVGPAPKLIREIVKHAFFETRIRFNVTRGEDLNTAAKMLLFEFNGRTQDTKRKDLDKFVEDTRLESVAELEQAARRVVDVLDQMVDVFAERDPLLRAAGIIPVYYWLVRHTERERQSRLREFLVRFERDRDQNRKLARAGAEAPLDEQLVMFDNLNRSTNDDYSHLGRYEILKKRFSTYWDRSRSKDPKK